MPTYKYQCPEGHESIDVCPARDRNDPIDCQHEGCGLPAERDMLGERKGGHTFEPYFDENLADDENPHGQWVKSRRHKKRLKRQQGKREELSFVE